jgi:hypothetical protein
MEYTKKQCATMKLASQHKNGMHKKKCATMKLASKHLKTYNI